MRDHFIVYRDPAGRFTRLRLGPGTNGFFSLAIVPFTDPGEPRAADAIYRVRGLRSDSDPTFRLANRLCLWLNGTRNEGARCPCDVPSSGDGDATIVLTPKGKAQGWLPVPRRI